MTSAADIITRKFGKLGARTAVILGSSIGRVGDSVEGAATISYRDLPGFPIPTVSGHAGELVGGRLGGVPVLMLKGRGHPYETGDAAVMRPAIEALQAAGIATLVLTNAAGSLVPSVGAGRLMLITDHINLSGMNPLIGDDGDARFVPMTHAYDPALAQRMRVAARREGIALAEGVYAWFSGPSFETPAEIRMARILGADAVGMSTVPETIIARRLGLTVAAVSVVTNLGAGMDEVVPSHQETKEQGDRAVGDMARLLARFLQE